MKRYVGLLLICLCFAQSSWAKLRLPHLLSDGMVLQQQTDVRLWGWDEPGTVVKVTPSWSDQTYQTTADSKGEFMLTVRTPKASYTPLSLTFDDGERTVLKNILAGEVWVCAGQSNMNMTLRGFANCPVEGYNDEIIASKHYPYIRFVKMPRLMRMKPLKDTKCSWKAVSPNTVDDCSAVAYFFGKTLSQALDIPIGLIQANKGGTRVESWLNEENLRKYTDESLDSISIVKRFPNDYNRTLMWGNGTFAPIINFTVKGIIYYQGCSNVGDKGDQYSIRLKALADQWRTDFREPTLPFYFVQIAPYYYGDANGIDGALLREQQLKASKSIANSVLVGTNDLVYPWEVKQIHPRQKRQVGQRLACVALNRNYGMKKIMCYSAAYKSSHFVGDTCFVRLSNDYGALSRYEGMEGFELAGSDRVFHPAKAYFDKHKGIVVTSPDVPHPIAVRYCFRNFLIGNVSNAAGLPLLSFRSDNW